MTAPMEACISFGSHRQALKQETSTELAATPASQEHMAAASINTPWNTFHNGLQSYDDVYANAISGDQSVMVWGTSSDPTSVPMQNNYQLETTPEQFDSTQYQMWPSYTPAQTSYLNSSQDVGTPRTFPTMDMGHMLPDYSGAANTISPQALYQVEPRSQPYHYVEENNVYAPHSIYDTVEETAQVHQPQVGYSNWFPERDHSVSYRSSPMEPEDEEEDYDNEKHEPYAKTLYRCLKEAPNHTMVLRDIYAWFKNNTSRGREPHAKGWQNSIRHNLSMNQAFEKIDNAGTHEPSRRGYRWRLTEAAVRAGGVQSTTRFRNKQPNKRGSKSHNPAPQRQLSGARGGRMARMSAIHRRSERLRETQNNLRQYHHNLRSHGIVRDMHSAPHPSRPTGDTMRGDSFADSTSSSASPFESYNSWTQYDGHHPLVTPSAATHSANYLPETTPNTPATQNSPERIWLPVCEKVFSESSDTTGTMPTSPDDFEGNIPQAHFAFGMDNGYQP